MTQFHLLVRNLLYHARTNAAVVLGVVAATAVITGALIVGDSVRGSLREMSLERLQKIDDVLITPRFVHEDLAGELAASPNFQERFETAAPALMLSATFVADRNGLSRRAGGVQILGGDQRLWQLINLHPADLTGNETAINARLAERLRVHAGDDVSLFIEIPSAIPRESLLGKREGDFREIPLKIKAVIPDDAGTARLTLNPTQQLPLNAFVPLATLQQSVELARVERSRRNPEGSPAQINALFVSAKAPADQTGATAPRRPAHSATTWQPFWSRPTLACGLRSTRLTDTSPSNRSSRFSTVPSPRPPPRVRRSWASAPRPCSTILPTS